MLEMVNMVNDVFVEKIEIKFVLDNPISFKFNQLMNLTFINDRQIVF